MNNQEAMKVITEAMGYSKKENSVKNMKNAVSCFAELNGWTSANALQNFIELCLKGAADYKADPMHTYILKDANDAANIALYIDNQAAQDIISQRAAI